MTSGGCAGAAPCPMDIPEIAALRLGSSAEFEAALPRLAAAQALLADAFSIGALLRLEEAIASAPAPFAHAFAMAGGDGRAKLSISMARPEGSPEPTAPLERIVDALEGEGLGEAPRILAAQFAAPGRRALLAFEKSMAEAVELLARSRPGLIGRTPVRFAPAPAPELAIQLGLGHLGARIEAARIEAGCSAAAAPSRKPCPL